MLLKALALKKVQALAALAVAGTGAGLLLYSTPNTPVNPPLILLKNVAVTGSFTNVVETTLDSTAMELQYRHTKEGLAITATFELEKPVTKKNIVVGWVQAITEGEDWGRYEDSQMVEYRGNGLLGDDPTKFSGGRMINTYPQLEQVHGVPASNGNNMPWVNLQCCETLVPNKTSYTITVNGALTGVFPFVDPNPDHASFRDPGVRLVQCYERNKFTNFLIAMDVLNKDIQLLWELNWDIEFDIGLIYADEDDTPIIAKQICQGKIDDNGLKFPTKGLLDVKDVVFQKDSTKFVEVKDTANYAYKCMWIGDNGVERPIPVDPPKPTPKTKKQKP